MSEDSLPKRLSFLFLSMLVAVNLSLVTYILATTKNHNMTLSQFMSMPRNARSIPNKTVRSLDKQFTAFARGVSNTTGSVMHDIAATPRNMATVATRALDINTYIKPANYTNLPRITPLAPLPSIATIKQPPPVAKVIAAPVAAPVHTASDQAGTVNTPTPNAGILTTAEDSYAWGNCTRWVAIRRAEVNDPIPSSWGNAATWADRAATDGYLVDKHPTPGSIMQTADSAGGLGHVAFVESVDPDGTWHISEMNVLGLDIVDHRTMPLSAAADYNFIHDKT